jgi:hypothetical protein
MEPFPHHYSRRQRGDDSAVTTVTESSAHVDSLVCIFLNKLQKMESCLGDRIEGHCSRLEHRVTETEQRSKERLISLEMARAELEQGHGALEKQFDGLRLEVHRMNCLLECDTMTQHQDKPDILSNPEIPIDNHPAGGPMLVPNPHRAEASSSHGMAPSTHTPAADSSHARTTPRGVDFSPSQACLLKLQFLVFSGEDPQLWCLRCENYFDMYGVESSLWIRVASMHFEGFAARWLQSVERLISSLTWAELCSMLHDWFGRDQHEALIRQLFHIRQVGSIADYVEHFSVLVDQLTAYQVTDNSLHYAMRFIDGLKEDTRPNVMIQRPSTLDSACALALDQEEALESHKKKDGTLYESSFSRLPHKPVYPLPVPPINDKGASSSAV